jgi:hypothetical protein
MLTCCHLTAAAAVGVGVAAVGVAAKGTATILVTSATGSSSNFRKTSFALPLGGNCPKTC